MTYEPGVEKKRSIIGKETIQAQKEKNIIPVVRRQKTIPESGIGVERSYKTSRLSGCIGWIVLGCASAALFINIMIFLANLVHVWRYVHSSYAYLSGSVLSVYPVVGTCMYLQILFPRAHFILDSAAQLWLVVCMYHFFKLTISYYGGESYFVESLEGTVLPWRGVPCCFWPCVWPCLPKQPISKKQIRMIRILIIQLPIVQGILTVVGLTLFAEVQYDDANRTIPKNLYLYVYNTGIIFFFFALWALVVTFKASLSKLVDFKYGGKVVAFQLTLVFVRFQSAIFKLILIPAAVIPCYPQFSARVMGNLLLCCLLLGELVILSVLANHFYRLSGADKKDFISPNKISPENMERNSSDSSTGLYEGHGAYSSPFYT